MDAHPPQKKKLSKEGESHIWHSLQILLGDDSPSKWISEQPCKVLLPLYSESEGTDNDSEHIHCEPRRLCNADALDPPCFDVDAQCLRMMTSETCHT